MNNPMNNPFHYGKPISPEEFIVPNKARLQAIVRQIITGESTAIVGEPHYGKTSLLKYLYSPAIRDGICSLQKEWRLVFQLMDYDLFQANNSGAAVFWEHALAPVGLLAGEAGNPGVKDAYERCVAGGYSNFGVEKLFSVLEENKIRLVLMIDEFDDILQHPILGKKEFLGTLRSLGTWKVSFALIITTRSTVDELNEHPQENDTIRRNSPYFNYFHQFILGPFTLESTRKLLKRAGGAFTPQEELTLVRMSDHNPHFLQMAAHALWDAYFTEQIAESAGRMEYVWKLLGKESASTLDDAWKHWTLRTKEVLTIVALDDLPRLIAIRGYDTRAFAEQLRDCSEEIEFLEDRGYITKSEGKYVISSQVLGSWLSKKITASFQNQDQFGKWLMANQPKRVLSEAQRDGLKNILVAFGGVLRQNSDLFIKVMAPPDMPAPALSGARTKGQPTVRSLKVFLCHSSGDKPAVRKLYERLCARQGIDPWLDEARLLPGEQWDVEISKAVRASDVVVVCLSKESVSKEGYVQKEIKRALDIADEKPEGTIYIIPFRLEECEVPQRLSQWQWVNSYEERSFEKLMMALRKRGEALGIKID